MTTSAWLMLGGTWAVVIGFTTYFFGKVLRHRGSPSDEAPGDDERWEGPRGDGA